MYTIIEILGKRIKNYRQKKHFSQEKLAELSGLHTTYIGQLERGEKNPSFVSLIKISNALEISVELLVEGLGEIKSGEEQTIPQKAYEIFSLLDTNDAEKMLIVLEDIYNFKFDK